MRTSRFLDITPVSPAMLRFWRSPVTLTSGALADTDSPLSSPLVADDLARTVSAAALRVFPSTTMTRPHVPGPGRSTPATVRQAMAHIDAHAHRPLPSAEIAAAAGTSVGALQHGFRRHLDTTPTGYLGRVRLERAHEELQRADPTRGDTVAA
ncbi:hypothetical protein, partial [Solicola sp. PLA-1-18]|uniref:hypothetical protein n=1 Tax=Solicola sp. PLA-1-18 TaxID=3380532 RepID=UPI003B77230D